MLPVRKDSSLRWLSRWVTLRDCFAKLDLSPPSEAFHLVGWEIWRLIVSSWAHN